MMQKILRMNKLYWLLIAAPIAIIGEFTHMPPLTLFLLACVALIPLAGLNRRKH